MSRHRFEINRRWRTLAWRDDGKSVRQQFTPEDGVRFDEIVVGSWLQIEQMNDHDYHCILGSQHFNVRVYKTKPPEVTFLFDDDEGNELDRLRAALKAIFQTWTEHHGQRQDVRYQECIRIAREALDA